MNIDFRLHDLINDPIGLIEYLSEFKNSNTFQFWRDMSSERHRLKFQNGFFKMIKKSAGLFYRIILSDVMVYF